MLKTTFINRNNLANLRMHGLLENLDPYNIVIMSCVSFALNKTKDSPYLPEVSELNQFATFCVCCVPIMFFAVHIAMHYRV